jgi:hypothetical protein
MKLYPVGNKSFHADRQMGGRTDGQTDTTILIFALRDLTNAPKNYNCVL